MLTKVYYSDFDKTQCPIGVQVVDSKGKPHEISFSSVGFDDDSNYDISTVRNHELGYIISNDMDWHSRVYGDFQMDSVYVTEQEFNLIKLYWQNFKSKLKMLKKVKWTGKCVAINLPIEKKERN